MQFRRKEARTQGGDDDAVSRTGRPGRRVQIGVRRRDAWYRGHRGGKRETDSWVRQLLSDLIRSARRGLGSEDAEDAAAEAVGRLVVQHRDFLGAEKGRRMASGILRNVASDVRKHAARAPLLMSSASMQESVAMPPQAPQRGARQRLADLLRKLRPLLSGRERCCLRLMIHGQDARHVANDLGVTGRSVRRIKDRLQGKLAFFLAASGGISESGSGRTTTNCGAHACRLPSSTVKPNRTPT